MKCELLITEDGSHTMITGENKISYHSIYGAIGESRHVFIEAGLQYALQAHPQANPLSIFEVGFGTGLNALLTYEEALRKGKNIHYYTVEPYPLLVAEAMSLNYVTQLNNAKLAPVFESLHTSDWDDDKVLSSFFTLRKEKRSLLEENKKEMYHLIYFDAFAPAIQPELWTREVFANLFEILYTNGILVTYCSKGDVRRAMQSVGFTVEKLVGPPHKREMIRAIKSVG